MAEGLRELAARDPEAFKKLLHSLRGKVVIPHVGGQQQIMESKARFQIVCCGRRFGKTVIGAKKALKKCREPNRMVWWVAPTYKVVKRGYREVVRQLPDGVLAHPTPQDSAFDAGRSVVLRFKNGSRMEFYSAERPEGMLGEGVDLVVMDEAALMPKAIWEQTIRPTLMDYKGEAIMISTPRGRNWFYFIWLRGQSDDPKDKAYESWKFTTADNPYIAEDEIEEMRNSMPLIVFEQEVLAEFISSAGSVFRFSPDIITERVKPDGHVVVGVDLAKSIDFTVFEAANAADGMPCAFDRFNEVSWPMQRDRLKGFCRRLRRDGATHVTLVMDSTGVGDPIVEDMELAGYDTVGINFTATKQHMVMQLAKDLEDGYVRIGSDHVDELENYTYKISDKGRFTYSAPEGQHDDVVSAIMLRHWGIVQEGAPNMTSISAGQPDEPGSLSDYDEPEVDDWSDLVDGTYSVDGAVEVRVLRPDSVTEIMNRAAAWGRE